MELLHKLKSSTYFDYKDKKVRINDRKYILDLLDIEKIREKLYFIEKNILNIQDRKELKIIDEIIEIIQKGNFIPQSTILINLSHKNIKPCGACMVPRINYKDINTRYIESLYNNEMGLGFNLNYFSDPIKELIKLNNLAKKIDKSDKKRPVANMGIIDIDNPNIYNFLKFLEAEFSLDEERKFNISINIKEKFMEAYLKEKNYYLKNNKKISPQDLLNYISQIAYHKGDPGIIFMERFEKKNPFSSLKLEAPAPCGEIALTSGESCIFGYLNLSKFIKNNEIDYNKLEKNIILGLRFLDDILEYTIFYYKDTIEGKILSQKRRIGIGICGWHDMLIKLRIPYNSKNALKIGGNIMSFINYISKKASMELSKKRGAFLNFTKYKNNIIKILKENYMKKDTEKINKDDWKWLINSILKYGIRNSHTTALPPTGKSSFILGVSPSIEPYFELNPGENLENRESKVIKDTLTFYLKEKKIQKIEPILENIKKIKKISSLKMFDRKFKEILAIYSEIPYIQHLKMVKSFQNFCDNSISKTINLFNNSSVDDVLNIFEKTYKYGLSGITVYKVGSYRNEPYKDVT